MAVPQRGAELDHSLARCLAQECWRWVAPLLVLIKARGLVLLERIEYNITVSQLAYGDMGVVQGMHVIYTRHAEQRMIHRKVSPEQVVETIESPDEILPGDNGEEIAIRRYGARELRVVYEEIEADTVVVYTVMKPRVRDWR